MSNKSKSVFIVFILLQGCVSQSYIDNKRAANNVSEQIDNLRPVAQLGNVQAISRPPIDINPIIKVYEISWLNTPISVHVSQLPLSVVLNSIIENAGVNIELTPEINANQLVTLSADTTLKNVLNILSSETGYAFVPSDNLISVQHYQSETFVINLPTGNISAQQGAQGNTSENNNSKVEGQYITVNSTNVNAVKEIEEAIRVILQSDSPDGISIGNAQAIPSLNSIIVRTTPSRMEQVRQVVENFQQEFAKQVLLEVHILEFRSDRGKDQGIDWQAIKDVGSGSLKFIIPGTTALATGNLSGMAFTGTGKWDGTTAFIKALEQQGTVSTSTPISMLALNSQPARISQTLTTPFISDISTQITDTTTSTSTSRSSVTEGVDMMVNPKVFDGSVYLRITGQLTKIASDNTETVNDTTLRFISTRDAELNFTNKLKYGQTVVIGSIKRETVAANKSTSFDIDGIGMQSSQNETIETLVLLTPRRVR